MASVAARAAATASETIDRMSDALAPGFTLPPCRAVAPTDRQATMPPGRGCREDTTTPRSSRRRLITASNSPRSTGFLPRPRRSYWSADVGVNATTLRRRLGLRLRALAGRRPEQESVNCIDGVVDVKRFGQVGDG